jgi:hypothetical protein
MAEKPNFEDYPVVDITVRDARFMVELDIDDNLATALDEEQAKVFDGTVDHTYVIIKIVKDPVA